MAVVPAQNDFFEKLMGTKIEILAGLGANRRLSLTI